MTAWPTEAAAMENMVENFGTGIYACVMDSYDYAKVRLSGVEARWWLSVGGEVVGGVMVGRGVTGTGSGEGMVFGGREPGGGRVVGARETRRWTGSPGRWLWVGKEGV